MKRIVSAFTIFIFLIGIHTDTLSAEFTPSSTAKALLLMEASSGKVLYEKNAHQSLPPASVTKIMTMLLLCEAIERGEIELSTQITASERAKSMGGSTIFLETNETMSLDDLMKGIAVASANDACVAVAEHISGSVESFVSLMNNRAKELGMKDTNFINCNGLDADGHHTSAYDIALMSRELLKHKTIEKYTSIWIDTLRDGKFQLANTNKLIRFYPGANGLKTGSTSKAGCCISATAKRDGMQLIAVVMGAETSKDRFSAASELLNFGFSNYSINSFSDKDCALNKIKVINGKKKNVAVTTQDDAVAVIDKKDSEKIKTHINIPKQILAPIKKGEIIGEIIFTLDGETISKTKLISKESVKKMDAADYFVIMLSGLFH